MLKKNKRNLMLMSGLAGSLIVSTAAGVALSSCTTTSSSTNNSSSDIQYSDIIDWNDADIIKNLVVDSQGLVYSSNAMTEIIGVSPNIALPTVTIPSTVKSITGYKKVVTTNGVKTYQSTGAFQGITTLIKIILPSDSQLQSIGDNAFNGCTNLLGFSTTGSYSISFVGQYAFNGCTNLKDINISDAISVGQYAFYNCSQLQTAFDSTIVDKSGSLLYVGDYAFYGCSNLAAVNLNKTVTIGQYAFYGCSSLANSYSVDATILTVGTNAFYGCTKLPAISLANCTSIGGAAFYNCSSLANVDISKITVLNTNTFYGCTSLETVKSPALTNINESVFYGCTSLTTIDLTNVTRAYRRAFYNCTSLRDIGSLENLVTTGFYTFYGAFAEGANLTLKLSKVSDISDYMFQNCKGIKKLDFSGNTNITLIGINSITNSSVQEIDLTGCTKFRSFESSACQNATSLTTVYLPTTGVNITIGSNSFSGATSLTTIAPKATEGETQKTGFVSTSNVTTVGAYALRNTPITSIDLTNYKGSTSSGVTTTGSASSFQYMPNLTSVNLGTSITRLDASGGTGVFSYSGLEGDGFDLVLPSNITGINVSSNGSPFTNSGLRSIDMSKITSYWNSGGLQKKSFGYMFSNTPKLQKVILMPGTTEISANAFTKTPLLNTVIIPTSAEENVSTITGFRGSNTLTTIGTGNFDSTSLETVDLTNLSTSTISGIASSFTNLPTGAVVKLPSGFTSTLNSTSFTTTASTSANIQYPSGVTIPAANISTGKLTNTTFLNNISGALDLTGNAITSIGENTFFGTSLGSLTLPAGSIVANTNLFSTAATITTNTSKKETPASYIKTSVPFGNNASLTGLNYSGFTSSNGTVTDAASLFNTTSAATWASVQQIINSLSNYSYKEGDASTTDDSKLPANLSTWTNDTAQTGSSKINADSTIAFTAATNSAAAKLTIGNVYANADATSTADPAITSATTSATFVHNGIIWTYTNNGTNITLTGDANMYKLTKDNTSYLTFFNTDQVEVSPSNVSSPTVTYNIPSQTKVKVTLTIATKASS